MASRAGQMWRNIKKSFVIFRSKDQFVGSDEFGNKYFEKPYDAKYDIKAQRRIEPKDPDQFTVPTVPVEWMTWLQGRRSEPPTEQEREKNRMNTLRTLNRAEELQKNRQEELNQIAATDENTSTPQQKTSQQGSAFPVYPGFEVTPGDDKKSKDKL